jgi:hypothetical protein
MAASASGSSPSAGRRLRLVTYGIAVATLVILTLGLHQIGCMRITVLQPWIELVNGATLPTDPKVIDLCGRSVWGFSAALALRTTINLGAALALLIVPVEYFVSRRKRIMNVRQLLESRELAALQAVKLAFASQPEAQKAAIKAVKEAGEDWDQTYLPAILTPEGAEQALTTPIVENERRGNRQDMVP